jgi:hypothetical protein
MNLAINLHQAWQLVKGSKGAFWLPALTIFLASGAILGIAWATHWTPYPTSSISHGNIIKEIVLLIVAFALTAPLYAGILMTAIKRARGEVISLKTGFQYYPQWLPILATGVMMAAISGGLTIFVNLVFSFVIIPLLPTAWVQQSFFILFLMLLSLLFFTIANVFLMFTLPLVVDRKLFPWTALKQSIDIVKPQSWKLVALFLIFYLIFIIKAFIAHLPYIGFIIDTVIIIWLLPFIFLNIGVAYHHLVDRG